MVELGSGSLYFLNGDEVPKKFGKVKDVELEGWADDASDFVIPPLGLEATFEATCKINRVLMLAITGVRDSVLDLCPNKKVVHLAKHGRNNKIRKKNFNRAIRILEEME